MTFQTNDRKLFERGQISCLFCPPCRVNFFPKPIRRLKPNLVPRGCDPWEGNEGSGIIRCRKPGILAKIELRIHFNGQSDSSLKRIIPEPSFPSQGSQARGTRLAKTHREANLVPRLFPLRASLGERPSGWSRVSQILGDNNWDLWGVGKTNVAFEFKTIYTRSVNKATQRTTAMKRSFYWHVFFIKYVITVIVRDEVVNKAWLDV